MCGKIPEAVVFLSRLVMGLKLGVFRFSRYQNNCDLSYAHVLPSEHEIKHV